MTPAAQCSHRFFELPEINNDSYQSVKSSAGNFFLRKGVINTSIKMICAEVFLFRRRKKNLFWNDGEKFVQKKIKIDVIF